MLSFSFFAKHGPNTGPEYNQCPKAARLPLAAARDSPLDYAAAEVGGNQSASCVRTAPQSAPSPMPTLFAKRANALVLNVRTHPH
jgi:hypothetical protein